jgi:type IV pilus modification protein PilV
MQGFSLFEVLIALVVLSVGLLGLASLQTNTLKFNQGAYLRTQATNLAYDMADRMRANRAAAIANAYDGVDYATTLPDCNPAGVSGTGVAARGTGVAHRASAAARQRRLSTPTAARSRSACWTKAAPALSKVQMQSL